MAKLKNELDEAKRTSQIEKVLLCFNIVQFWLQFANTLQKELQIAVEKLKNELDEAKRTSQIEKVLLSVNIAQY